MLLRLVGASLVACCTIGCGPSIAELRQDRACQTWIDGGVSRYVARVDRAQAVLRAALGEQPMAYYGSATEIEMPTMFGKQHVGSYANGMLTIHTVLGDRGPIPVAGEQARIPGPLGDLVVDHNERCRPPQVALGTVSLFFAVASSSAQH